MKLHLLILLAFTLINLKAQECDPMTASKVIMHNNLLHNILVGDEAFNSIMVKTGIGPDGDLDSREYKPLVYSSNIWAGGVDPVGNYKLAAGINNQQDWVAGPLDVYGSTNSEVCDFWDQIFSYTKEEALAAYEIYNNDGDCTTMPASILNWPARGNPNIPELPDEHLAPFYDNDSDGYYDPCAGDLPVLNIANCNLEDFEGYTKHLPSEASFYIINDKGATHHVSQAEPIRIEIQVYTFTVKTQEAEDIIFWQYKTISKATEDIRDFKFATWYDFDLGCTDNDLIATEVEHNMIYAYNGLSEESCDDNSILADAPTFGLSVLKGQLVPLIHANINGVDTLINPPLGSGVADTLVEYKLTSSSIPVDCEPIGNTNCSPLLAPEFYNLLIGKKTDGTPIFDENGKETVYAYTGNPTFDDSYSLCNSQEVPATTAIMSIGQGIMMPSAKNEYLIAGFMTRDGDPACPDPAAIIHKQQQAQELYSKCYFNYLTPPSPTLTSHFNNGEIILSLSNIPTEYYEYIPEAHGFDDRKYEFEGVKIYQVGSKNFDLSELENTNVSKLVYQGDIVNEVDDIYNWKSKYVGSNRIFEPKRKVDGKNEGIKSEIIYDYDHLHNQDIDENKEYYFVAVSYAYNEYEEFSPIIETGQQYPYLESNYGLKVVDTEMAQNINTLVDSEVYKFYHQSNTFKLSEVMEDLDIKLLNMNGQELNHWEIQKGAILDSGALSHLLPSGIYFLNVFSHISQRQQTHKLIITN